MTTNTTLARMADLAALRDAYTAAQAAYKAAINARMSNPTVAGALRTASEARTAYNAARTTQNGN